jgi:hypothetical protein
MKELSDLATESSTSLDKKATAARPQVESTRYLCGNVETHRHKPRTTAKPHHRPASTAGHHRKTTKSQVAAISSSLVIGTIILVVLLIMAYRKRKREREDLEKARLIPLSGRKKVRPKPKATTKATLAPLKKECRTTATQRADIRKARTLSAPAQIHVETTKRYGQFFGDTDIFGGGVVYRTRSQHQIRSPSTEPAKTSRESMEVPENNSSPPKSEWHSKVKIRSSV